MARSWNGNINNNRVHVWCFTLVWELIYGLRTSCNGLGLCEEIPGWKQWMKSIWVYQSIWAGLSMKEALIDNMLQIKRTIIQKSGLPRASCDPDRTRRGHPHTEQFASFWTGRGERPRTSPSPCGCVRRNRARRKKETERERDTPSIRPRSIHFSASNPSNPCFTFIKSASVIIFWNGGVYLCADGSVIIMTIIELLMLIHKKGKVWGGCSCSCVVRRTNYSLDQNAQNCCRQRYHWRISRKKKKIPLAHGNCFTI
jgi:hypothetical protein